MLAFELVVVFSFWSCGLIRASRVGGDFRLGSYGELEVVVVSVGCARLWLGLGIAICSWVVGVLVPHLESTIGNITLGLSVLQTHVLNLIKCTLRCAFRFLLRVVINLFTGLLLDCFIGAERRDAQILDFDSLLKVGFLDLVALSTSVYLSLPVPLSLSLFNFSSVNPK
ncbi:hypothetical protein KC19_3G161400 [Ceratodon purpureus]|uniref:Uncharacterized protein n=1 Tax=Ceratodon purpureus TaxID=3225 RepID=A0A8T0IKH8_CERPU|nr:hypothetical protein KC19_3G161400 [Ceratodon purpureus]